MAEISDLMKLALQASAIAEEQILKYYGQEIGVEWKADQTPVTIADRNAEESVRKFFQQETPDFGMIGEEFGVEKPEAPYQWILDPIDGTKSFVRGVPLFGTILALWKGDQPILGLIRLPALRSTLHAAKGQGAYCDGKKVQVSSIADISDATVLSGTVNTMEKKGYGEGFTRLRQSAYLYRGWGDCYGYYLVATGKVECMVDPVVSIWDIAAMPILFSEAGGHFSQINGSTQLFDAQGHPTAPSEGYTGIATNGIIHTKSLQLLSK